MLKRLVPLEYGVGGAINIYKHFVYLIVEENTVPSSFRD